MRSLLVVISVIVGLGSVPVLAQGKDTIRLQLPPAAECDGNYAIVRISQLVPGGSMEEFLKVVEAHKAWYRSHGFGDNQIYTTRILARDATTNEWKYSDDEIMTFHVRPPQELTVDAAWEAFVKRYKSVATLKSEYIICLPKNQ